MHLVEVILTRELWETWNLMSHITAVFSQLSIMENVNNVSMELKRHNLAKIIILAFVRDMSTCQYNNNNYNVFIVLQCQLKDHLCRKVT